MSKEEKEDYKTARYPAIKTSSKRKLPTDTSVASKLARFAASKDWFQRLSQQQQEQFSFVLDQLDT